MIKSFLGKQGPITPKEPLPPKKIIKFPPVPSPSGNNDNKVVREKTTNTVTTTKREGLSNYHYIGKIGLPGRATLRAYR